MSIVRIDPEGWRHAEDIAIIVLVNLVPIQITLAVAVIGSKQLV